MKKLQAILKNSLPVLVALAIWELGLRDMVADLMGKNN